MPVICPCGRKVRLEREHLGTCWECRGRWDACPFCGEFKKIESKRCQACRTKQQREQPRWCACGTFLDEQTWSHRSRRKFSYQCNRCVAKEVTQRNLVIKADVFAHYGGICECCGETNLILLTLDHKNDDGNEHRKALGGSGGAWFYRWVRKNGFPDFLRILCFNCNIGRYRNGGACPHEEERLKLAA